MHHWGTGTVMSQSSSMQFTLLPVQHFGQLLCTDSQVLRNHCFALAYRGIFQRNLGLRGWWVDWVRDIVLNMHGQDLTALKNAMDDGGDAHNIHKLIYNDILVSCTCTCDVAFSTAPYVIGLTKPVA